MIPGKFKVSPREFQKEAGILFRSPLLTVKTKANNLAYNRYAAVVGSGAYKKAAERHRIKRAVLGRAAKMPGEGRDYLFIAKHQPRIPSKAELDAEFEKIMAKI